MHKVKQINNWIIKEKRLDEMPLSTDLERKYCVFSPSGIFQEDNLTLQEAEEFCKDNLDYVNYAKIFNENCKKVNKNKIL